MKMFLKRIFVQIVEIRVISRLHILQSIKPEQISQCSIISHPGPFTQQYLSSCCLFPGFENNPQIRKLMLTFHQGWKEIFKQTSNNIQPSLASLTDGSITHFALIGK